MPQLVREDILNGRVNGEELVDFLPADLCALIPEYSKMTDKETRNGTKKRAAWGKALEDDR